MSKVWEERAYQKDATRLVLESLNKKGNTILAVATGGGKTFMSALVCRSMILMSMKILVIQHTEELIEQNKKSITQVCGEHGTIVKAQKDDFSGNLVFASRQTLARKNRRENMPSFDLVVIDECHVLGYEGIVDELRELNPRMKVLGLTATPYFSKGSKIFNNVAYSLDIPTLVNWGYLVPPMCKVIDLGIQKEINSITVVGDDFNMAQAEKIMNKTVLNEAILESWKIEANDRKTIAFCTTVVDAEGLNDTFAKAGVKTAVFHGGLPKKERKKLIEDFTHGDLQCLMSVMALTAGFDSPPCSCVIIKRPFLYKSTFIQAVGRGLRKCSPLEFPNIYKKDCMVLDFACASLKHGDLMAELLINGDSKKKGDAVTKNCPVCESELYLSMRQCPFCGYEYQFEEKEKGIIKEFAMSEYDLINASPFRWLNLSADQNCIMASTLDAWGVCVFRGDKWHALASSKNGKIHYLSDGQKARCIKACDDFLFATCHNNKGKGYNAWMNDMPTQLQISGLSAKGVYLSPIQTDELVYDYHKTPEYPKGRYIRKTIMISQDGLEVSKYSAALLLTLLNNKPKILAKLNEYC